MLLALLASWCAYISGLIVAMLSGRTKQVVSYGRRGRRIVNASDDQRRTENETHDVDPYLAPSHIPGKNPKLEVNPPVHLDASPFNPRPLAKTHKYTKRTTVKAKKSPKVMKIGKTEVSVPTRHPLALYSSNAPRSPAVSSLVPKKRKVQTHKSPLKPSSPIVNLDILVLDNQGRRVSQERRVSRTDVQVNSVDAAVPGARKAWRQMRCSDISSDADEFVAPRQARMKRGTKARPIVISDGSGTDEEDDYPLAKIPKPDFTAESPPRIQSEVSLFPSPPILHARSRAAAAPNPAPSRPSFPPQAPEFIVWKPVSEPIYDPTAFSSLAPQKAKSRKTIPEASSRAFIAPGHSPFPHASKARKVTPYRAQRTRTSLFPAPPSPPSPITPTDYDLSFDLAALAISPTTRKSVEAAEKRAWPPSPAHLRPLLAECAQERPHEFSAFIGSFPFDSIVHGDTSRGCTFQKIGEASYSEVFGIGDVVLKVIPLRDEVRLEADECAVESPAPSDAKDVLKEIFVTRAMGDMCPGFVKLLRTYVVRGKYPSLLLDLWDKYNAKKGSESVRPDSFSVSQMYAIIVLPNGGPDLETFAFKATAKTGWRQACSLFWQVARSLAEAEELVHFEHRDLHWGQILVKTVSAAPVSRKGAGRVPMDDEAHGIEATVIDLGLARMEASGSDGHATHWTPFEEEIFQGEGDYQFDVYRMMRAHNGDSWKEYRPLTNVMWLHYLASKLLYSKCLRPPAAARTTGVRPRKSDTFTERECHACLVEMEELLGRCVAACKSRKSRRMTQAVRKAALVEAPGPKCAGDVLRLAVSRGWVSASG